MSSLGRGYTVRWKDSPRWDIKSARATLFRLAHPSFRRLGEFAEEATELVRPWEGPQHEWPVYGVNNTDGVFLSYRQRGDKFNAPYKRIRRDWFFHNPTRANVGSLGRVPDVPDDAITSPEYQVWRIRETLLPDFVAILIKTKLFIDLIDCHRVGAVKERLFVANLLEIPIPVVARTQQQAVVARWERTQAQVGELQQRVAKLEERIEAEFLADLGLSKAQRTGLPRVFAARWRDVARWGVRPNQLAATSIDVHQGEYPVVTGHACLREIKHGCSASPSPKATHLEVLKINAVTRGSFRPDKRKFMYDRESYRNECDLRSGDVLLCRTNGTLGLVGMSALVEQDMPNLIFPDKIIRIRVNSNILPEFLWKALHMPFARSQIEAAARTAVGNFAIGTEDLRKLELPLPPLTIQQELVDNIAKHKDEVERLSAESERLAEQAKVDAEAVMVGRTEVA